MSINLRLSAWQIDYELDQMSRYLDLIQSSLDQRLDEINTAYNKDLEAGIFEDEPDLDDYYTDQFLDFGQDFPMRLMSSFIVAWFSFIEQKLLDFCEQLALKIEVTPKNSQDLGTGIRRGKKFLLKARNYEIDKDHWNELVKISQLRNLIVHRGTHFIGSYTKPENSEVVSLKLDSLDIYFHLENNLFQYIKTNKLYEQTGMSIEILPTFDYCNHLVKFGREFFSRLYSDLKSKRSKIK